MSWGCLNYLRWPVQGGLWPGFPTHSPSCLGPSSAARGQAAHHRALQHPGSERVYKRRNTDARQSQLSSNRQRSLRHVCRSYPGWSDGIEDLKLTRGWRITLYRGWTPPCEWREGGTTEDYRRHHTQRHNQGSNTWVVSRHNIPSWTPWGQGRTLYWGPVGHYQ